MSKILHISDLHFGPPFIPKVAEAVLQHSRELDPDVVVVSGDLTQRAKSEQFQAASEYLKQFERPIVVVPGNHDVPLFRFWGRFLSPHGGYLAHVSPDLDSVTEVPGLTIVGLNSTRRLTLTNGRIRRWQLEYARRAFLASDPSALRVVVTHHHLAPAQDFASGNVMPFAKRAVRWFTDLKVDMILAGHMHRSYIGSSLDFFPGDLERRGIVIVQCGTTTSRRGRGRERSKNTFNLVRAEENVIRVAHYAWMSNLGRFVPISDHFFPRGPKQYFEHAIEIGTPELA